MTSRPIKAHQLYTEDARTQVTSSKSTNILLNLLIYIELTQDKDSALNYINGAILTILFSEL